jgi:hypothetical protein
MPSLTKIEIKNYSMEAHVQGEDFIEGYGYVIELDDDNPTKFNTSHVRKVLPTKLKLYYRNMQKLEFNIIKDGRELRKTIPFDLSYKPSLKFFFDKDECLESYAKDKDRAIQILKNKYEALNSLQEELNANYQYLA